MKVMLDNLGLVDFALGEVNSVLDMCEVKFLGVIQNTDQWCYQWCSSNILIWAS